MTVGIDATIGGRFSFPRLGISGADVGASAGTSTGFPIGATVGTDATIGGRVGFP